MLTCVHYLRACARARACVARYGDSNTGAVDGQAFAVDLLRRGKRAELRHAQSHRVANAARRAAAAAAEQRRTHRLVAAKPTAVDFDFGADDVAEVKKNREGESSKQATTQYIRRVGMKTASAAHSQTQGETVSLFVSGLDAFLEVFSTNGRLMLLGSLSPLFVISCFCLFLGGGNRSRPCWRPPGWTCSRRGAASRRVPRAGSGRSRANRGGRRRSSATA